MSTRFASPRIISGVLILAMSACNPVPTPPPSIATLAPSSPPLTALPTSTSLSPTSTLAPSSPPPTAVPSATSLPPTQTVEPTKKPFVNVLVYELPEMYQVSISTIQYTTVSEPQKTLDMDIFYPLNRQPGESLPAVILANDFALTKYPEYGSRSFDLFQSWGRLIAASGMIAVAYDTLYPDDLQAVVNHIQEHDVELGIDANQLGLWSASSHVMLASSFAFQDNRDYLKFAVFYYGPILTPDNFMREEANQAWGYGVKLSDATLIPSDLPVFVVKCGRDQSLNKLPIDHFAQLATEAGMPVTLVELEEGSHMFDWSDTSFGEVKAKAEEIVKQTLAFMKMHTTRP